MKSVFKETVRLGYLTTGFWLLFAVWTLAPLSKVLAANDPTYRYTKTAVIQNGSDYSDGAGVATDTNGNVYSVGYFDGTVTFDGTGGQDTITAPNSEAFITKHNKNGDYVWTKILDSSANGLSASSILNVAVDSSNNVYVTGQFVGTVTFDGTGGSHTLTSENNNGDGFLTKFNADGSYGWTKTFDVTNASIGGNESVAIDQKNGYIYETGQFNGTMGFDGQGGTDMQSSGDNNAVYLTKYNLSDGAYISTQVIAGADVSSAAMTPQGGEEVAVDSSGNVYVSGVSTGTVNVNGTGQSFTSTDTQTFLTKFNGSGALIWGKALGNVNSGDLSENTSLAVYGTHVYLAGRFKGSVAFDGPGGTQILDGGSINSSYLVSYSTSGSYEWVRTIGLNSGGSWARNDAVTTDYLGKIYVSGGFNGPVSLDGPGGTDIQGSNLTTEAAYLTKLEPNGAYDWSKLMYPDGGTNGSLQDSNFMGVATDNFGNVYVSGDFYGQVAFNGPQGSDMQSADNDTAFLMSYGAFPPLPIVSSADAAGPTAPNTGIGPALNDYLLVMLAAVGVSILLYALRSQLRQKHD